MKSMKRVLPKHIYIICTSLNMGGAEMQSIWLANSLVKKGYKVSFVVLKKGRELARYLDLEVNLIEYKMYSNENKTFLLLRKIFNFYRAIRLFRKNIKGKNANVVSFLFHANILGFLSTIFTNSKHYICIRNDRFSSRLTTKNLQYRTFLVKIASHFANYIVYNSKKSFNSLNHHLSKKTSSKIIFNTVLNFDDKIQPNISHQISKFLAGNNLTFVSIGRLEKLKNYENIINAFELLKKSGVKFKYIIFGGGYLKNELKQIIKNKNLEDNILMIGKVHNAINYLHYFNFYLLCSVHEGFPNSLIESMKSGLIPIVTDAGDSYYLVDSKRGIKVESILPIDIYKKLLHVTKITDKEEFIQIKQNIDKFIQSDLNEDIIFNQWLEILDS